MNISVRYSIDPAKIKIHEGAHRVFLDEFQQRQKVNDKESYDRWRQTMKSFRFGSSFLRQFEDDEIKVLLGRKAVVEIVVENPEVSGALLQHDRRVNVDFVRGIHVIVRDVPPILKPGIYTEGDLFVAVTIDKQTTSGQTLSVSMTSHLDCEVNVYYWLVSASNVIRAAIGLPNISTYAVPFEQALPKDNKE